VNGEWLSRRPNGVRRIAAQAAHHTVVARSLPDGNRREAQVHCEPDAPAARVPRVCEVGGERPRRHTIRHSPYSLDVRVLDVESEPDALLAQVDELASGLAASAGVVRSA
jgi:hypothetical protein